jgi:uncharacterized protein
MKSWIFALAIGFCVGCVSIFGFKVPEFKGYVTDMASILSPDQVQELNQASLHVSRQTGAQVATLIVSDIGDESVQDVANTTFRKWGIGQKGKDNGVLFLVALQQKKIWIEVGYGLEGVLPDGRVGRIRDEVIFPAFRQKQIDLGVMRGHKALIQAITQGSVEKTNAKPTSDWKQTDRSLILIILVVMGIIWFLSRKGFSPRRWNVLTFIWVLFSFLGSIRGGQSDSGDGFDGFGGGDSGGGGAGGSW